MPDFDTPKPHRPNRPNGLPTPSIAKGLRPLLVSGGILLFVVVAIPLGLLVSSCSLMGGPQEADGDRHHHEAVNPNEDPTDDIAFVANGGDLSLINADGTDQIYLDRNKSVHPDPLYDWSSDGEEMVFASITDSKLYVLNADGTGLRKLTDTPVNPGEQPDWSPVGEEIVFVRKPVGSSNKDLYIINADGTDERNLTGNGYPESESSPAFSPDAKKVAFVLNENIYVIRADGTDQTNLTGTGFSDTGLLERESSPTWTPDGKKIAFIRDRYVSARYGGKRGYLPVHDLYVMNADGTGQTRLAKNVAENPEPYSTDIAYSPDGKKIAFEREQSVRASDASKNFVGATDIPANDIYVINADGTGLRKLTDTSKAREAGPAWSPDGKKIAFSRCCENAAEIANASASASARESISPIEGLYVINTDGTGVRKLTDTPVNITMNITWRPVK